MIGRPSAWWGGVLAAIGLTAIVAGAAGALSFNALRVLAVSVYLPAGLAPLYPVSIDGMLGVATLAAVMHRTAPLRTRAYIWALIAAAIAVSVSGNALHATGHGGDLHLPVLMAAGASAVPAASLAASLHLLVVIVRTSSGHRSAAETDTDRTYEWPADEPDEPPAGPRRRLTAEEAVAARRRLSRWLKDEPALGPAQVAQRLGVSRATAKRWLSEARRPHVLAEEEVR